MRTACCLVAAGVFVHGGARGAEEAPARSLLQFTLRESAGDIAKVFGASAHSARAGGYSVLEFGAESLGHNDLGYAWTFYFDQPSGDLQSVTHNLEEPVSVAALFPAGESRVHRRDRSEVNAISRALPGGRVLIAIGMAGTREGCTQIILMRRSAVRRFYPWIAAGLD